jgi:hypothetical protein
MTDKPAPTNQPDTDNNDLPDDDPAESSAPASSGDDFGVESALAALSALAQEPDVEPSDDPDGDAISAPSHADDHTEAADDTSADTETATEADIDIETVSDDDLTDYTDSAAGSVPSSAPQRDRVQMPETIPGTKLYRGQAASVVPALLLIASGAVLLFLVTTSDIVLTLPVSIALASAAIGVVLLAHWFSAERRATGNFFIGLTLLSGGGLGMYALQSGVTLQTAWPLFLVVPGGTLLATALISRDELRHAALIGLLLLVAGAGGFALLEFVL